MRNLHVYGRYSTTEIRLVGGRRITIAAATPDERLARLADAQRAHGSHTQLLALGFTDGTIGRRVGKGVLRRRHRGVYAIGHTLPVEGGEETAALLAIGDPAALAVRSANAWWGWGKPRAGEVELILPGHRSARRRPGIRVHRSSLLTPRDIVIHRGLPVTSPEWTLRDLAASAEHREAEWALNEALESGRVSPTKIRELAARHPGHPGGPRLLALLDPARGRGVTRQAAEERMLSILRAAGIGGAERNATIGPYRVDFLWREAAVVVEVDSYTWHRGPAAFKRDRRKDLYLRDRDLDVLRVTWEMMDAPLTLVARVVRAIERGLALRSRA